MLLENVQVIQNIVYYIVEEGATVMVVRVYRTHLHVVALKTREQRV